MIDRQIEVIDIQMGISFLDEEVKGIVEFNILIKILGYRVRFGFDEDKFF